jgi:hypothetical protein
MKENWNDLTSAEVEYEFKAMAEKDAGYAIAWALMRLAMAQEKTAEAMQREGFSANTRSPGTAEFRSRQMERAVEAMAGKAASRRSQD